MNLKHSKVNDFSNNNVLVLVEGEKPNKKMYAVCIENPLFQRLFPLFYLSLQGQMGDFIIYYDLFLFRYNEFIESCNIFLESSNFINLLV